MTEKLGVIELFAGAAGLGQGFLKTKKFDLLSLTDTEISAKQTFEANYPDIPYVHENIINLEPSKLKETTKNKTVHGLLGGPPCQGFSAAGHKKQDDERNKLIHEYARFVDFFQPRFLLMENVPQILFHSNFEQFISSLSKNYEVGYTVLNAAQYGTPQTRHRAFVLAYHRDLKVTPTFPMPTHEFIEREVFDYRGRVFLNSSDGAKARLSILGADSVSRRRTQYSAEFDNAPRKLIPLISVTDAIGDLVDAVNGEAIPTEALSMYQKRLRNASQVLTNFDIRVHETKMQKRIEMILEGGDLRDITNPYYLPKSHYSQAYGRLHRQGLARTITTFFGNSGSGRFLHPTNQRTITVREAARLQGFDDSFEFHGNRAQQMTLVGNAVPIPLAEALANHIAYSLKAAI